MSPARSAFARAVRATVVFWTACGLSIAAAADETPEKLFRTGRYEECVDAAVERLESNVRDEAAWLLKLRSELALGRYKDAAETYTDSLRGIPFSVQTRWIGQDALRLAGRPDDADRADTEIALWLQRAPWQYSDAANQVVVGRWLLQQGADPKKILAELFNEVKRAEPKFVDVWLAIGDMALDKHDYQLAGEAYQQAAKLDAERPEALLGVAKAFAPSDSEKAEPALQAALKANPRMVDALLMVVDAHVDAERYEAADETLDKIDAVNPRHPLAHAYRAVLAHLNNKPEDEKKEREAALEPWSENPAVDHLIGKKLSQKYRFAEGAERQRRALEFDPDFRPAKGQLAQDLLRLGNEEEGLALAEAVHAEDAYDVFAFNLVTLQENLAKFRTLEEDGLVVRMDAAEAEIYGPRVLRLLKRAKSELAGKYGVSLDRPIIVELFPSQQDFAIRTFGLPGGSGFLGVCFGNVVTAPSPGSPAAKSSCWEATLWHEFCHVVTLAKTHNKMPRWLSEGISVYEERQADPTWGQRMTPQYREMILGSELTPVSRLSGAFLNPKSGLHLNFAYYESSLVVEYLIEKHGREELDRVLTDLAAGLSINESLGRVTGILEELDEKFAEYARAKAEAFAPEADWSEPELGPRATLGEVAAWVEKHPHNHAALTRLAQLQLAAERWKDAEATLQTLRRICPEHAGGGNPYAALARIHRETGDAEAERAVLNELASRSSDDLAAFERLGELAIASGDWRTAKTFVEKSLGVNPMSPAIQRRAATVAEKLGDWPWAIESGRALARLAPFEAAEVNYRLAVAYRGAGDLASAKRHTLWALEETPRYRAAQELLLELVEAAAVPPPAAATNAPGEENPRGEKTDELRPGAEALKTLEPSSPEASR